MKTCADFGPVTPLGLAIHEFLFRATAARAVRRRRTVIAELVDQLAGETKNPRILSVAAGHLREATLSDAVQNGKVGEFPNIFLSQKSRTYTGSLFPIGSIIFVAVLPRRFKFGRAEDDAEYFF